MGVIKMTRSKQVTTRQKVNIWAIAIATILGFFGVKEADRLIPVIHTINQAIVETLEPETVTEIDVDTGKTTTYPK